MAHRLHCTKLQLRATRKLSVDKFEPFHRVSGSSCNQIVGGRVEVDRDPVAGDGADVGGVEGPATVQVLGGLAPVPAHVAVGDEDPGDGGRTVGGS